MAKYADHLADEEKYCNAW